MASRDLQAQEEKEEENIETSSLEGDENNESTEDDEEDDDKRVKVREKDNQEEEDDKSGLEEDESSEDTTGDEDVEEDSGEDVKAREKTKEDEDDDKTRVKDDNTREEKDGISEGVEKDETHETLSGRRKGMVEMMNNYLESIFATEEEHDEEIEAELNAMYGLLWKILSATIGVIGVVVALTKYPQYLASLHENHLWFSNIKEMEREISFRTEQGLYYSYYKQLVNSHTWLEGFSQLLRDNRTEHSRTINIFHRFNILPEMILSLVYRWSMTEESASVWYVWCVFGLHGIYAATLYLTAWHLSGSVLSGAIAVILLVIHRADVTRVNYTVPLRESFAVPILATQTLLLCSYLRPSVVQKVKLVGILLLTMAMLLSWQFGPFILLCQLVCLAVLCRLALLPQSKVVAVLGILLTSLVLSCVVQSCPPLVISSPALSLAPVALLLAATPLDRSLGAFLRATVAAAELALLALATLLINGFIKIFLNQDADSHIYRLLLAKLRMGDPRDFDSRLYMCTDAFDYMDTDTLMRLCVSGLLPVYTLGVLVYMVSGLCAFLRPVEYEYEEEYVEDEGNEDQGFGNENQEYAIDDDYSRISDGIHLLDSEIEKIAHLVAGTYPYDTHEAQKPETEVPKSSPSQETSSATPNISSGQHCSLIEGKPDLVFFVAVSLVSGVLAILVMRLKVLWLPGMCVVCGVLVGDVRLYSAIASSLTCLPHAVASRLPRCLPTCLKILFCCAYLTWLVQEHWGIVWSEVWPEEVYEFWDPDTVSLMEWLNSHTSKTAVLAGSMQLMAGVKLCTGRSVTNHPHYEDAWLRHRTHQVYRMYGCESPEAVYVALRGMGATHIILEDSICLAAPDNMKPLCRITDIVDMHNGYEPEGGPHQITTSLQSPQHPRFCDEVRHATGDYARYFSLVMENKTFRVYRLAHMHRNDAHMYHRDAQVHHSDTHSHQSNIHMQHKDTHTHSINRHTPQTDTHTHYTDAHAHPKDTHIHHIDRHTCHQGAPNQHMDTHTHNTDAHSHHTDTDNDRANAHTDIHTHDTATHKHTNSHVRNIDVHTPQAVKHSHQKGTLTQHTETYKKHTNPHTHHMDSHIKDTNTHTQHKDTHTHHTDLHTSHTDPHTHQKETHTQHTDSNTHHIDIHLHHTGSHK